MRLKTAKRLEIGEVLVCEDPSPKVGVWNRVPLQPEMNRILRTPGHTQRNEVARREIRRGVFVLSPADHGVVQQFFHLPRGDPQVLNILDSGNPLLASVGS